MLPRQFFPVAQRRLLLRPHRPRGEPPRRLPRRPIMQRDQVLAFQHLRLHRGPLRRCRKVFRQMPVEITLGERGVVARERGQHLRGIARRGLVRLTQQLGPLGNPRFGPAHPHRADVLAGMRRDRVHPAIQPVRLEIPVLMVAPQRAPGLPVRHHGAPARAAYLRVQVTRLLRAELLALEPPRGDQQVRVPVRALRLLGTVMRRVHVELHRQTLGDEVLRGKRVGERDPVLNADACVGRQCQHDLARDLRVLAFLGRLRRIPQHRAGAKARIGALGQQHVMVLGRVAVPEVVELARALGGDRLACVIGRRAHRAAAAAAGNVARAGELDGHDQLLPWRCSASQIALPCNAYCVCTLPLAHALAGAEPAARFIAVKLSHAESRFCALARMPRRSYRRPHPTTRGNDGAAATRTARLWRPHHGNLHHRRYGTHVFAGPFDSESAAIGWIDQRQDALNQRRPARETAVH